MVLSRDNILGAMDYKIHRVLVDEWGGEVCVRPFTTKLRDRIEMMSSKGDATKSLTAVAMAGSICDEAGKLLFSEADIAKLEEKDAAACSKVSAKILEINSISDAKIEQAEKN
jgi:Mrp family chromosome partitioning ATPase